MLLGELMCDISRNICIDKEKMESMKHLTNGAFRLYIMMEYYSNGQEEFSFPHRIFKNVYSNQGFINSRNELIEKGFLDDFVSNKDARVENKYKFSDKWKKFCLFTENNQSHKTCGYVYFIQSKGVYKIGITKNKDIRLKTFCTSLPFEYTLIKVVKAKNYKKVEQLLHEKYSGKRIRGEWFNLNNFEKNEIVEYLKTIEINE